MTEPTAPAATAVSPSSERTYARICNGVVLELLTTARDPAKLFHPSLRWVEVTGQTLGVGWTQTATGFAAPPPAAAAAAPPTLAMLQAELARLSARIEAFAKAQTTAG